MPPHKEYSGNFYWTYYKLSFVIHGWFLGAPTVDANDSFALRNVLKKIESFAPLHLAESWDNVGLLVEPPSSVPVRVKTLLVF